MPQMIEANGIRFAYHALGKGPLVILLHGFPDTAKAWDDLPGDVQQRLETLEFKATLRTAHLRLTGRAGVPTILSQPFCPNHSGASVRAHPFGRIHSDYARAV